MQSPLQITFHNLPHSDLIESDIRARVEKLTSLFDRVIGCRVVIDTPHRSQSPKGKTYAVKIELQVPGPDLVIRTEPVGDCHQAIAEAFDAAKRRLKEHAERSRGG